MLANSLSKILLSNPSLPLQWKADIAFSPEPTLCHELVAYPTDAPGFYHFSTLHMLSGTMKEQENMSEEIPTISGLTNSQNEFTLELASTA